MCQDVGIFLLGGARGKYCKLSSVETNRRNMDSTLLKEAATCTTSGRFFFLFECFFGGYLGHMEGRELRHYGGDSVCVQYSCSEYSSIKTLFY